ncbi:cytosine permease [Salicibibacter cibi]|uniref:Cytosine permease n=1 Tax=Salicibibacter cibi TaxID=2743001 RepID=A0A7T6Z8W0_9BACI|nr:cytosine permease [Salicibibacter cibi]QQK78867.1 cytosine permease [Salicibibacter cibi]
MVKVKMGSNLSGSFQDRWDSSLYNSDLAPVPTEKKSWTWWTYACIWMGIAHNVNQWIIVAIMIQQGMSFWQAFGVVCFVFGIVYIAIVANSIAGAKFGIPFPVIIRAAFGHRAALVPIFIRGVMGIFWFGIFMFLASEAIDVAFGAVIPGWGGLEDIRILGMGLNTLIGYAISIALHYFVITKGIQRIKNFEMWAGPVIMVVAIGLVFWAMDVAGGFMPLITIESTISGGEFWSLFFLSATGIIGTVATLIVNISDLTRYARSQKDHLIGSLIGVPGMFILFSAITLLVTAGSVIAFGDAVYDPIQIIAQLDNNFLVFIAAITVLFSIIGLNAATNAVAVGFDLAALAPKYLSFSRAGVIAIVIGVFMVPWLWYGQAETMNNIMGILGSLMGALLAIMLVDFYFVRRRKYDVDSLFMKHGEYEYKNGFNWRGITAFAIGSFIALIGLIIPQLGWLYSFNWFLGIAGAGISYMILTTRKVDKEKNTEVTTSDDIAN